MPRLPVPLPASLAYPVFTAEEARLAGVPVWRLRAQDLEQREFGLYAQRGVPVTEANIVAAYCRLDPPTFAAGLTAARILGLPLRGRLGDEVTTPPMSASIYTRGTGGRRRRRIDRIDRRIHLATTGVRRGDTALIRWSQLVVGDGQMIRTSSGLRVTSRLRTFQDLAPVLSHEGLVAIGDHLVRIPRERFEQRAEPFVPLTELRAAADAFSGRGALAFRRAVARVRVSSDSPAETALRLAFVDAGMPEPVVNQPAVVDGVRLGEPDMYWPGLKVMVEHEGPSHLTKEQQARDIDRTERRTRAGCIEVRTVAEDLSSGCARAVDRVRWALRKQGWEG